LPIKIEGIKPRRASDYGRSRHAHGGDVNAFYLGALQSLCWDCHERTKKQIERRGYSARSAWIASPFRG